LIPEHLQVKNVSARSGGVTFITNGIQSGSSTAEIAASTKHKSTETLAGYAQKTDHIMGATGLSIAKRANELKKSTSLGGVETAIDEPAKKLRRRGTTRGGNATRRGEARVRWPQFQGSQLDDSDESDEEGNGEPMPIAAESTSTSAVDDQKQVRFSEASISTSSTTGKTTIVNKNYYFF
jgi:hypothetical protein